MQKIEFKDFPITDTPIDADNLNTIQDNVEISINEVQDNVERSISEVQDNVERSINEVDNATNYLTAAATTDGDYKVNISNILETNMILNITFPAATTPASNARLSIDNGTIYKNVFFGIQLSASEIENTTQSIYYDGTQWQLSNKKNTITAYLNANKSIAIGSTFTAYLLEIPAQYQVSGNKITYDSVNKCVKIGAGITKVKISAAIMIKGIIGTPIVGVRINRGGTYTLLIETYGSKLPDTTGYISFSQAPGEVLVQENDLIELYVSSSVTGTFTVAGASRLWTYLTVEEV